MAGALAGWLRARGTNPRDGGGVNGHLRVGNFVTLMPLQAGQDTMAGWHLAAPPAPPPYRIGESEKMREREREEQNE